MLRPVRTTLVLLASIAGCGAALAQTTSPDSPLATKPGATAGLSKGPVVHPGNPDPGMDVAPPRTGTMPVVPPPGTPANNPALVPK